MRVAQRGHALGGGTGQELGQLDALKVGIVRLLLGLEVLLDRLALLQAPKGMLIELASHAVRPSGDELHPGDVLPDLERLDVGEAATEAAVGDLASLPTSVVATSSIVPPGPTLFPLALSRASSAEPALARRGRSPVDVDLHGRARLEHEEIGVGQRLSIASLTPGWGISEGTSAPPAGALYSG